MSKSERIKKVKEQALQEDVEHIKKATGATGHGFVDYEIPPDEVDEKDPFTPR